MASTPPLDFDHIFGEEIHTKHKEAIRQLHWVGKLSIGPLESRYKLGNSTIRRILRYDAPERFRLFETVGNGGVGGYREGADEDIQRQWQIAAVSAIHVEKLSRVQRPVHGRIVRDDELPVEIAQVGFGAKSQRI